MCGIYAYAGKNNAEKRVIEGLQKLEYRGYDSWGIASLKQETEPIILYKQVGAITLTKYPPVPQTTLTIGHTRWATHGAVSIANAHPHLNSQGSLALIHNGVVENLAELEAEIGDYAYQSQTDTERLVVYLSQLVDSGMELKQAVALLASKIEGNSAMVIMDKASKSLIGLSVGLPLYLGYGTNQSFYLASDLAAFPAQVKQYTPVALGQLVQIGQETCQWYQLAEPVAAIKPTKLVMPQIDANTTRGKYAHYMLKEIFDQTAVLQEYASRSYSKLRQNAQIISQSKLVYLVGCGSSYHACCYGQQLLNQAGYTTISCLGSEFDLYKNLITPTDTVIMVSQSGETADLLEHLDYLKTTGVSVLAWVNVGHSTLAQKATLAYLLQAGQEQAVVSTKAFVAQVASFQALAAILQNQSKTHLFKAERAEVERILKPSYHPQLLAPVLAAITQARNIFVLGRGLSYPLALETALKIKEASYINAQAMPAGELKHGSLALVDKRTVCVVHILDNAHQEKLLVSAAEIKARGGQIIGIANQAEPVFDFYLPSLGSKDQIESLGQAIWGQLLAYYLAVQKGLNPDRPRNLAKSVTVG